MKAGKFIKKNALLIIILGVGLFLRIYKAQELFLYGHDQDLAGWFVRDVLDNKHLRLIGQETSTQGIFIGPFYYYLLIPFYLLFDKDPIGGVVLVTLLGMFSLWSVYWVFTKVFNKIAGILGAFVYAISFYTVFNDREVVPTMPVSLWTIWLIYALYLALKGKNNKAALLSGVLIGLIWNLNFALVLTIPLIVIAYSISRQKVGGRTIIYGMGSFLFSSLPLIFFELRHSFLQTKALINAFTTPQRDIFTGWNKLLRVTQLMSKNISGLFLGDVSINYFWFALFLTLIFIFLVITKVIKKQWAILFSVWIITYIAFFSLYSKAVSEYYLNGLTIVWVLLFGLFLSFLLQSKRYKLVGSAVIVIFALVNIFRVLNTHINRSGYLYRKALVSEIKNDSRLRGFPCVAISYITKPGYDLGYRYFFYLENLHVNRPNSGSPVYTIVFPLNEKLFPADKTFGALGLIYPDYGKYNDSQVKISCSGANSNLTDPMFGFTN